ncbi:hypothetical protein [Parasutterella sp.]|uniref:hypothetical protein n=1 Tax=Parasutterella sp. TaxID=2049037 RepID=UPI003AB21802
MESSDDGSIHRTQGVRCPDRQLFAVFECGIDARFIRAICRSLNQITVENVMSLINQDCCASVVSA